jgi:drug/metabolite transporter (DMT)-like permease
MMSAAPDPMARRPSAGVALVIASTLAFAVGPVGARLAFEDGSNTLTVVALRGVVAAALMALLVLLLRQHFRLDRRAWRWTLACGTLQGIAVYSFLGSVALVPVGVAVLIFFTHPLLLATLAHWRGTERLTARKAVLMGAAFGGLALVLGPELVGIDLAGLALAALSSVAMSGLILCIGRAQLRASSTQVNLYATLVSTLALGLVATLLGAWAPPTGNTGWLGILAAGLGVGLGLLAFFAALRHLSLVRASVLSSVEPLFSILLAAAVLGQALRPEQWAGALVIVGALSLFEASGQQLPVARRKPWRPWVAAAKSKAGEETKPS